MINVNYFAVNDNKFVKISEDIYGYSIIINVLTGDIVDTISIDSSKDTTYIYNKNNNTNINIYDIVKYINTLKQPKNYYYDNEKSDLTKMVFNKKN